MTIYFSKLLILNGYSLSNVAPPCKGPPNLTTGGWYIDFLSKDDTFHLVSAVYYMYNITDMDSISFVKLGSRAEIAN